jgi:hypothetical protein
MAFSAKLLLWEKEVIFFIIEHMIADSAGQRLVIMEPSLANKQGTLPVNGCLR